MSRKVCMLMVMLCALVPSLVSAAWGFWENGTVTPVNRGRAIDVNDVGQVVGHMGQAFLWDNGKQIGLGILSGRGGHSEAISINNSGQVVGWSTTDKGKNRAFLWENGVMTDLGTLGGSGSSSHARDINNAGQVVGGYTLHLNGLIKNRSFIWENGVMTDFGTLGTLSGESVSVSGINDEGQVVGTHFTAASGSSAFLWENGVMTDLGTLGGSGSSSHASDINNAGQVVGNYTLNVNGKNKQRSFIWENGVMTDLGAHDSPSAYKINDAGQVFGTKNGPRLISGTIRSGFLWENGSIKDLGHHLGVSMAGINSSGQIVGYIPIPPAIVFMFSGLIGLVLIRLRNQVN